MECGKLTAKLRDAVPVCFIENGKEVKRFKNIEIPDEIKKLPYQRLCQNISQPGFRRHWCRQRPRASPWRKLPKQLRRAQRSLPS